MISFAKKHHIPALKSLWKKAFGDTDESVNFYFENMFTEDNMLVCEQDGNVCAMLSMLPLKIVCGKTAYKARYIFAVATDEAYRGRGISTKLIQYAHEYMQGIGIDFSILVPASESLFNFYADRGYETRFYMKKIKVRPEDVEKYHGTVNVSLCDANEYEKYRQEVFGEKVFAAWDKDMLQKIISYMSIFGAKFVGFNADGIDGAAYVYQSKNEVSIKELAYDEQAYMKALEILATQYDGLEYEVNLPAAYNDGEPYAMVKSLSGIEVDFTKGYFNLTMD